MTVAELLADLAAMVRDHPKTIEWEVEVTVYRRGPGGHRVHGDGAVVTKDQAAERVLVMGTDNGRGRKA